MSDFDKAASSGLRLGGRPASTLDRIGLDIEDDFLVFDNMIAVEYVKLGPQTRTSTGQIEQSRDVYPVPHAVVHKVQDRDIRLNEGWLRTGDQYFELFKKDLSIEPRIGDVILYNGEEWRVLGFGSPTLQTRHQLVCRK